MEYAEWLEEQQWFGRKEIDLKQMEVLEHHAEKLLRERNYQEVTNLLKEHRDSYEAVQVIGMQIPFWNMIRTPADIADKHIVEMMGGFKDTHYIKAQQDLLASVPTARPSSILQKLAMHTFMLHYYLLKHPECEILCPKLTEVNSAKRILDTISKEIDAMGFYYLALKTISPDENFEDEPELFNRRPLSYEEVETIKNQAKKLIEKRNLQEITNLLKQYRHSYEVVEDISLRIARTNLIYTPEDAASKNMMDLIEIIKSTRYFKTLDPVPETRANIVQGMTAMHTFMLNVYLQKHPESDIIRPTFTEVDSAKRTLDIWRKDKNALELSDLALLGAMPSYYVQYRYGLAKDCETLKKLYEIEFEESKDTPQETEYRMNCAVKIEERLVKEAEKALESISDVYAYVPDAYINRLNNELYNLGKLAQNPQLIDSDMVYCQDYYFLDRYGIEKNSPVSQLLQQIEAAYRSLDARLVRLIGREPYADRLFASLKQQTTTPGDKKRREQQQRKPVKKQQSKGRKLHF